MKKKLYIKLEDYKGKCVDFTADPIETPEQLAIALKHAEESFLTEDVFPREQVPIMNRKHGTSCEKIPCLPCSVK